MSTATDLLEGFWTYQTPISFLAGVGVYHLYCRIIHKGVYDKDKEADVPKE